MSLPFLPGGDQRNPNGSQCETRDFWVEKGFTNCDLSRRVVRGLRRVGLSPEHPTRVGPCPSSLHGLTRLPTSSLLCRDGTRDRRVSNFVWVYRRPVPEFPCRTISESKGQREVTTRERCPPQPLSGALPFLVPDAGSDTQDRGRSYGDPVTMGTYVTH